MVVGHPRLHFGLFDLGTATPRIYGGMGAAIEGPATTATATNADAFEVEVESRDRSNEYADSVRAAMARLTTHFSYETPVHLRIHTRAPAHVGLGTKTTVVLSALVAVSLHLGLEISQRQLQVLSGRGGTSGVGVHTFFSGGYVLDGGHRAGPKRDYAPSSAGPPAAIPPALVSLRMPTRWAVMLLFPSGKRVFATAEADFFQRNTPIPSADVKDAICLGLMGLATAIAESDLASFAQTLAAQHRNGFKAREVAAQPVSVGKLLRRLEAIDGVAAGMSSMGPLVFAVWDRDDSSSHRVVSAVASDEGLSTIGPIGFRNSGYSLC